MQLQEVNFGNSLEVVKPYSTDFILRAQARTTAKARTQGNGFGVQTLTVRHSSKLTKR